jgi:peptidoglycan/xylan/chitin deacetylase (PgdA/CDA1 family)
MDILNGRTSKTPAPSRSADTKPKPRRHFSPLDALQGRMVVKPAPEEEEPPARTRSDRRRRTDGVTYPARLEPVESADIETIDYRQPPSASDAIRTHAPAEANRSRSETVASPATAAHTRQPTPKPRSVPAAEPTASVHAAPKPAPKPKPRMATAPAAPIWHTPRTKVLYMTFDDGPVRGTANLLRVLKEEGVKATLFCIGKRVEKHPKLFHAALATPEVLVANHTYSHANNRYRRFYTGPIQHVVDDIDRAQKLIGGAKYLRLAGRDVWRLPKLSRNDWAITVAQRNREIDRYDAVANRGYFIFGWDIEWRFSHTTQKPLFGGAEMARRVEALYRSGKMARKNKVVLLAHDYMWRTEPAVRQLRLFIRIMKEQGWRFETVDQYCNTTPEIYAKRKTAPIVHPAQQMALQAKLLAEKHPAATAPKKPKKHYTRLELVTRLNEAIRRQQFIRMRKLIAEGARVNDRDADGNLPLNVAIQTNNAVLVRMLVERGANLFGVDAHGMSPMGVARQYNNTIIVRYLQRQIRKQQLHKLHRTIFAYSHDRFAG